MSDDKSKRIGDVVAAMAESEFRITPPRGYRPPPPRDGAGGLSPEAVGVPGRIGRVLGQLRETAAVRALRRLEGDAGQPPGADWAVLLGPPGAGKSVAAAAFLVRQHRGRWVSAADFCVLSGYAPEVELYLRTPVLVLDDLGQEYADRQGYSAQRIEHLITVRHAEMRQTVITTNLTLVQIREAYGLRVTSRLRECASLVQLGNQGDMRSGGAS